MYGWSSHIAAYGSTRQGCQSCSWSAEQGKLCFFPCPRSRLRIWSRETGSAVPSRVSPLILHTQAESDWLVLNRGIPPVFRDGVHVYRLPPSGQSRVYRVTQLRTDDINCPECARLRASSSRGSSSTRCFCFHSSPWTNFYAPLFFYHNRKKRFARKCRRRTRPERRRIAKTSQNVSRARSRTGELNIATWNVRSLSLTGRRGAGHAEVLLQKCKVLGCDVIGLQETRRPGRTEFATAGYRVFCSGVDGSTGRAGQHGVGLAVKESIIREATWTQELTNERLMSMTFNLTGKSNAVTFIVAYGPTDTVSNTREQKAVFWTDLESAVSRVPSSDYLFVLIDANARTGVRIREEDCKVIGAYGRDTRVSDSNGTSLLRFASDNKLALVNTFFSVPKGCTSRTFNGTRPADRKRIDYIITRQPHRKLVRNVTVHLQPHADSDHNIVCARVRLPGRFARNRKQRAPTGRKSIDRRAITSDTDRRKRLIQLVAIQLTQTELGGLGGTVGEKAALFTDTLLRSAEEVMPGQIRQSRISGLLEDEAMHDEFEEAWTEREEARKAVHGTVAGGSAFRALRTACKKLRDVIQAAEDRYLEVFACELEEFIAAGDLRGWYGHLKGGWKLQGKKLRGAQYIRDENGKLLRKLDEIRARWRRYFTSLLNTTSVTLNRTIIEGLSQKPIALSLGDPPVVSETKKALRSMANGKAMGPDELPVEPWAFRQFPRNLTPIPRHHRGCMVDGGSTAGVEGCHHKSSTQEEGSDRM